MVHRLAMDEHQVVKLTPVLNRLLNIRQYYSRLVHRYLNQNQLISAEFWAAHLFNVSCQAFRLSQEVAPNSDDTLPDEMSLTGAVVSQNDVPNATEEIKHSSNVVKNSKNTHSVPNSRVKSVQRTISSGGAAADCDHQKRVRTLKQRQPVQTEHTTTPESPHVGREASASGSNSNNTSSGSGVSGEGDTVTLSFRMLRRYMIDDATLQARILVLDGQHQRAVHLLRSRQMHTVDLRALHMTALAMYKVGEANGALDIIEEGRCVIEAAVSALGGNTIGESIQQQLPQHVGPNMSDCENDRNMANCQRHGGVVSSNLATSSTRRRHSRSITSRRRVNANVSTNKLPTQSASSPSSRSAAGTAGNAADAGETNHSHGSDFDSSGVDDEGDSARHILAAITCLKGYILDAMDNRARAAAAFQEALAYDAHCAEALLALSQHQVLTRRAEVQLLNSLPVEGQSDSAEEGALLRHLYQLRLKKCDGLTQRQTVDIQLSQPPESTLVSAAIEQSECPDVIVQQADAAFHNCQFDVCLVLTNRILSTDPFHPATLPIHVSALVQTRDTIALFSLAHKLIDAQPESAVAWFAVGSYYYAIGRQDLARRYLSKATVVDRLLPPAWLTYGHSFALDNEHDQAMAAYFKASQLLTGCHLPLLYIGVEYAVTNNLSLARCFLRLAWAMAPEDPFLLHELGLVHYQSGEYAEAETCMMRALTSLSECNLRYEVMTSTSTGTGENARGHSAQMTLSGMWEPLLTNLGHVSRKLGAYDRAIDFHAQALVILDADSSGSVDGGVADAHTAIGFNRALQGNYGAAVESLHKALSLRRDDAFATVLLDAAVQQLAEEGPPAPPPAFQHDVQLTKVNDGSCCNVSADNGQQSRVVSAETQAAVARRRRVAATDTAMATTTAAATRATGVDPADMEEAVAAATAVVDMHEAASASVMSLLEGVVSSSAATVRVGNVSVMDEDGEDDMDIASPLPSSAAATDTDTPRDAAPRTTPQTRRSTAAAAAAATAANSTMPPTPRQ